MSEIARARVCTCAPLNSIARACGLSLTTTAVHREGYQVCTKVKKMWVTCLPIIHRPAHNIFTPIPAMASDILPPSLHPSLLQGNSTGSLPHFAGLSGFTRRVCAGFGTIPRSRDYCEVPLQQQTSPAHILPSRSRANDESIARSSTNESRASTLVPFPNEHQPLYLVVEKNKIY